MNLGFIGTGKIASSVITGICNSQISYKKIIVSHRNKAISQKLKKKFKKIVIVKNNQKIIDDPQRSTEVEILFFMSLYSCFSLVNYEK